MSIRQHDFTLERRFRQTPAQTFRAFADPALKQRWFGPPDEWGDAEWSLDFRVGGGELSSARDTDGVMHVFRSRYQDIVEGERIVFAYDLLLDDRLISVSLTAGAIRLLVRLVQPGWDCRGHRSPFENRCLDRSPDTPPETCTSRIRGAQSTPVTDLVCSSRVTFTPPPRGSPVSSAAECWLNISG